MKDFILLMHSDTKREVESADWEAYIATLTSSGCFQGGSTIGSGKCLRKAGPIGPLHEVLCGFIRITAKDLDEASIYVHGNPVFEAGGTVELRELPRS